MLIVSLFLLLLVATVSADTLIHQRVKAFEYPMSVIPPLDWESFADDEK